jgi:hypothetical protein
MSKCPHCNEKIDAGGWFSTPSPHRCYQKQYADDLRAKKLAEQRRIREIEAVEEQQRLEADRLALIENFRQNPGAIAEVVLELKDMVKSLQNDVRMVYAKCDVRCNSISCNHCLNLRHIN